MGQMTSNFKYMYTRTSRITSPKMGTLGQLEVEICSIEVGGREPAIFEDLHKMALRIIDGVFLPDEYE